ncbi:MAG TPA: hypothetical protein VMR54_17940 [Thermoanaerobaculia bacterium]|nr:hypothetical protein [Thermoanaerobaculia bacterium]
MSLPGIRSASYLLFAVFLGVPSVPAAAQAPEAPSSPAPAPVSLEERLKQLEKLLAETRAELAALKAAPTDAATQARLQELDRKIDILTREIEKLKLGEAAATVSAEEYGVGPAAAKVYGKTGLSIGGYGEVLYQNFAKHDQSGGPSDAENQITLLRAVLYVGYKFDKHFVLNTEIEYENAVVASDKGGEAEVEFAYVDYMNSRAFNARAGLMLIPMGLVNELHEPTTYLGARRPSVDEFIIPTTWRELGAGIYGSYGPLVYRAYAVNGLNAAGYSADEGIREGRQEGSEALAEDWAFTGRVDYVGVPGLLVGAAVFTGDSGQGRFTPSGQEVSAPTTVWDVHANWQWRGLWLRGVYAQTTIGQANLVNQLNNFEGDESVGSLQEGWYVQAAFDLLSLRPASRMTLMPYVLYGQYNTQKRVPVGYESNPANDVRELTAGLAFKPIDRLILKADWTQRHNAAQTGVNQWSVNLGYVF